MVTSARSCARLGPQRVERDEGEDHRCEAARPEPADEPDGVDAQPTADQRDRHGHHPHDGEAHHGVDDRARVDPGSQDGPTNAAPKMTQTTNDENRPTVSVNSVACEFPRLAVPNTSPATNAATNPLPEESPPPRRPRARG